MHGPDVTATRGRGKPPPEADQFASLVLERGALAGQVRRPGPRSETASASFVIQRMTAARVLIAPGTEAATSGNGQRVTANHVSLLQNHADVVIFFAASYGFRETPASAWGITELQQP